MSDTPEVTSDEVDGLLRCDTCKLLFDPDEEGSTEEVNECGPCGDARMQEALAEYRKEKARG